MDCTLPEVDEKVLSLLEDFARGDTPFFLCCLTLAGAGLDGPGTARTARRSCPE